MTERELIDDLYHAIKTRHDWLNQIRDTHLYQLLFLELLLEKMEAFYRASGGRKVPE